MAAHTKSSKKIFQAIFRRCPLKSRKRPAVEREMHRLNGCYTLLADACVTLAIGKTFTIDWPITKIQKSLASLCSPSRLQKAANVTLYRIVNWGIHGTFLNRLRSCQCNQNAGLGSMQMQEVTLLCS